MSLHIIDEANRCLNCKKPMCQQGCPVHTPIPRVIQMFKEHKMTEAGETLFQNNPLSVVCSIVCNHEMQCEGHCVLGKKATPFIFEVSKTIFLMAIWTGWKSRKKKRTASVPQ